MLRLALLAAPSVLLFATRAAAQTPDHESLRGMPATYEMWREERDLVRARVRDAERTAEAAEDSGDEVAEARAERELEAARDAHEAFADRTTSRKPAMLVGGIMLTTAGAVSGLLGLYILSIGPRMGGDDRTAEIVAWAVPTVGAIGAGIPMIVVGGPKRWRGADPVDPRVGIGPGTVSLGGKF